jgi:DNA-binding NarL/FixJ family response regulator
MSPGSIALSNRERQVVELAAHGFANKVIACELGLTLSTVSVYLVKAGRKLGVRGRVALIRSYWYALQDELRLPAHLSQSERAVAMLILTGASNAEIGTARGKSARTIANQVSSIFRKLGVGSRGQLAARYGHSRLPQRSFSPVEAGRAAPPPAPPS